MPTTGADKGDRPRALYALLNLPVTATSDEIRDRYKALAILLHPDKQPDPGLKEAAGRKFLQIQEAYDVLSDPALRAAYDALGTHEGGQWSITQKFKSAEEIRAEFDRASVLSLDARIQPRGQLAVTVDGRGLVDGSDAALVDRFREVNITNFRVQHSVGGRLNSTSRGRLLGFSSISVGSDSRTEYNAVATLWHQYSPKLSFIATFPILRFRRFRLKSEYRLDEATTISASTTAGASIIPSSVAIALQRRMFPQSSVFGAVTLQMGSQSSFTCAMLSQAENRSQDASWSVQLSLSPGDASVGCRWGAGLGFTGTRASVGLLLSPAGGLGALFEGEWSGEDTKLGLSVVGNGNGMTMTFSLSRFGQEFVLPVLLSDSYSLDLGLVTTLIPTGLFLVIHQLAIRPRLRARLKRKHQIEMELNAQAIEDARQEAIRVSAVLQPAAMRKMQHEERKNGLIIIAASYSAHLPESAHFFRSGGLDDMAELGHVHDVTLVLQALVISSQLSIPAGQSKSDIMGFYDPAPSLPKVLKIRYSYRGKFHYVEVEDLAGLVLPLRSHASEK